MDYDKITLAELKKGYQYGIGQGEIGFDALLRAVTHPALRGLPFTLETPTDTAGHAAEIAVLREAVEKIG